MNFVEFLVFIITMVAFFILVLKQAREERRRRRHPELYAENEEQEEEIHEILESLNIPVPKQLREKAAAPTIPQIPVEEVKEVEKPPSEMKTFLQDSPFKRALVKDGVYVDPFALRKRELAKSFDEEVFQQLGRQRIQIHEIIQGPDSLRHAVILKEILGPPKGL